MASIFMENLINGMQSCIAHEPRPTIVLFKENLKEFTHF